MSTTGSMTHCDALFLAGQRNATNGKAGVWAETFDSSRETSLLVFVVWEGSFFFFLDLWGVPGVAIPIASPLKEREGSLRVQWTDQFECVRHRGRYVPWF